MKELSMQSRQTFGRVLSRKEKTKKVLDDAAVEASTSGERSVAARGLVMLQQSLQSGRIDVHDCKDPNMPQYQAALEDFEIREEDWDRRTGWGRRQVENLYGKRYLKQFRAFVIEIYNAGAKKSTLKKGPAQILEEIQEKYPGIYRFPGEHDIASLISSLFAKEKKSGELDEGGGSEEEEDGEGMAAKHIPIVIDRELRRLIDENPGETGKHIANRLNDFYHGVFPECFPNSNENKRHVMARVNYLRNYQRQKELKAARRRLIG
jgi:hypothetical protein